MIRSSGNGLFCEYDTCISINYENKGQKFGHMLYFYCIFVQNCFQDEVKRLM